jgi:hypothetical protein
MGPTRGQADSAALARPAGSRRTTRAVRLLGSAAAAPGPVGFHHPGRTALEPRRDPAHPGPPPPAAVVAAAGGLPRLPGAGTERGTHRGELAGFGSSRPGSRRSAGVRSVGAFAAPLPRDPRGRDSGASGRHPKPPGSKSTLTLVTLRATPEDERRRVPMSAANCTGRGPEVGALPRRDPGAVRLAPHGTLRGTGTPRGGRPPHHALPSRHRCRPEAAGAGVRLRPRAPAPDPR